MRNFTLFLTSVIFGTLLCVAQENNEDILNQYVPHDYSVIPPSPEVASLMKYIDFPVSYFTGQPDITIPIYTLTEGDLTVPISISYHGGGIKVNEHPGIIGMGWTLIAGGSVSRTVYGLPDEMHTKIGTDMGIRGIFNLNSSDKTLRNIIINRNAHYDPEIPVSRQVKEIGDYCHDYDEGKVDMANDMLNFSVMGMSGTFIMDENTRNITLSSGSPVKISSNFNSSLIRYYPDTFFVTDNNYVKYSFGEKEKTRYEYSYFSGGQSVSDSLQYTSAWHLHQITNIYNDKVSFKYSEGRFKRLNNGPYHYYAYLRERESFPDQSTKTASIVYYYPKSLVSIEGKSAVVKFHYDPLFEVLEKITVHRKDAQNTVIKQFEFTHITKKMGLQDKRFLSQIDEVTPDKRITLYKFSYFGGSTLGKEYTYAQDHWGYYNGVVNESLLCEFGNEIGLVTMMAKSREADLNSTRIGSLSSVTYPTGGKTYFEWELNDYSNILGYKIPQVETTDTIKRSFRLCGLAPHQNLSTGTFDVPTKNSTTIYIDMSKYVKALMDGVEQNMWSQPWLDKYNADHTSEFNQDPDMPQVHIMKMEPNGTETIVKRYFFDRKTSDMGINILSPIPGRYYFKLLNPRNFEGVPANTINYYFGEGSYGYQNERGYVPITVKTSVKVPPSPMKKWGGLRIKSITSYSNNDQICKKYEYKSVENEKVYSSGVIQMEPDYDYEAVKGKVKVYLPASHFEIKVLSFKCSTSNGLYSTPLGGAKVEYPEVWEYYSGNNMENIKIKYNYSSLSSYPDVSNTLFESYMPGGARMMTSYAHQRGILTQKSFYKSNNTIYKSISYNYNILEGTSPLFTGQFTQIADFRAISVDSVESNYTVSRYRLIPYNKLLGSEITTDYDIYGDEIYSDSIEYSYFRVQYSDRPDHSLVRSRSHRNALGEIVTTYYTYYKPSGGTIYTDLKETEVTVINNKIISAKRMQYDMHLHRLLKVYSMPVNSSVKASYNLGSDYSAPQALLDAINIPEYQYLYDGRGNLVQIAYNGEILASYLWGYNGMYPILEAKGVGIYELSQALTSLGVSSTEQLSDTTDDSAISSLLSQLRTKFPGKDLITMTYHWLIGVSTATDSRGVTTHFSFDDFGRLKDVKDYNGYFIRKYEYHYAGTQQ